MLTGYLTCQHRCSAAGHWTQNVIVSLACLSYVTGTLDLSLFSEEILDNCVHTDIMLLTVGSLQTKRVTLNIDGI